MKRLSLIILHFWISAMKGEIHSMHKNEVWNLIDKPKLVKPIKCK